MEQTQAGKSRILAAALSALLLAGCEAGPRLSVLGPNYKPISSEVAAIAAPHAPGEAPAAAPQGQALRCAVPKAAARFGPAADIPVTGVPIHFANAQVGFDRPAPHVGEHNDAVYGDWLGYSPERIAELRAHGVI